MALSDTKIKRLAEKAKDLENAANAEGDTVSCLTEALRCYNRLTSAEPDRAYFFAHRSDVKCRLDGVVSAVSRTSYLDSAIDDINRAIELEPDKGDYYRLRGSYRLERTLQENKNLNPSMARQIGEDLRACISRDPSQPDVWLYSLAFNTIIQDWDEVISIYGQSKPYVNSGEDLVVRSYFGCLAFAFAGDPIEDGDIAPLRAAQPGHVTSTLIKMAAPFIIEAVQEDKSEEKKQKVRMINELFINHIDSWFQKGFLLDNLLCQPEEALKAYEKEIELAPDWAAAWGNKGWVCEKLGHYQRALEAYTKCIEFNPEDQRAVGNRINVLIQMGSWRSLLYILKELFNLKKWLTWLKS